jgi:hypothetical protein
LNFYILIDQGLNKRREDFKDAPLLTYRHRHVLRDKGEKILEK